MLKGSFLHHAVRFFEGILCEKMKKTTHSLKCCVENKFGERSKLCVFPHWFPSSNMTQGFSASWLREGVGIILAAYDFTFDFQAISSAPKSSTSRKKQQDSNRANGCVAQEIAWPPQETETTCFLGGPSSFFGGPSSGKCSPSSLPVCFLVREIETFSTL